VHAAGIPFERKLLCPLVWRDFFAHIHLGINASVPVTCFPVRAMIQRNGGAA